MPKGRTSVATLANSWVDAPPALTECSGAVSSTARNRSWTTLGASGSIGEIAVTLAPAGGNAGIAVQLAFWLDVGGVATNKCPLRNATSVVTPACTTGTSASTGALLGSSGSDPHD